MALRDFTDANGTRWTVWSTVPASLTGVPPELRDGWLTFEAGGLRKRLAPIPRGWQDVAEDRLRLYCSAAESLAPSRRSLAQDAHPD